MGLIIKFDENEVNLNNVSVKKKYKRSKASNSNKCKVYYNDNKEKVSLTRKAYHQANKEKINERKRELYRLKNALETT